MATYFSNYDTSYGCRSQMWGLSGNWFYEPSQTLQPEKESKYSEVYFDPKNLIV